MTTVTMSLEDSQEAKNAIDAVMREYNYPANPANAARVGWRAARLFYIALYAPAKPVDCRGWADWAQSRACYASNTKVTK